MWAWPGVAIDSIYDMRVLFDGIPLDQMTVSMTMNGAVLPVLALFIVAGEEQGVGHDQLSGTIQNDILKEFMVRNTYIYPPEPSMRIVADIIGYTSRADAALQLDFDLRLPHAGSRCDGGPGARLHARRRYRICARGDCARGSTWTVCPKAVLLLGHRHELLHGDRQDARRALILWAKLMPKSSSAEERQVAQRCAPTAQTSGWSLSAQDVYNNVIRTCVEAMAATQGHTQSLHTNASRRSALRCRRTFPRASPATHSSCCKRKAAQRACHRSVERQLLRGTPDARSCSQGDGAYQRDQ
jgi:methylmalonyl-CoA mutase